MGGYNISHQMVIIIILISGGISNWLSLMYRGESGELRIFVKEIMNYLAALSSMLDNPQMTDADVLKRLPSWPEDRPEELLPLPGFVFSD